MSIRCALGWHNIVETGKTFLGFYTHGKCKRCGGKFVRIPPFDFWRDAP